MSTLAEQIDPPEQEAVEAPSQPNAEAASEPEKKEPEKEEKPAIDAEKEAQHRRNLQAALTEERKKRQELERNQNLLAERYSQIVQTLQQPKREIPPEDVDPLVNHGARIAEAEKKQQQILQSMQEEQRRQQAQQQEMAFRTHVSSLEAEFARSTPDYGDAFKFMVGRRVKELEAAGYAQHQIAQIVDQNAMMISWDAIQNGKNPAEVLYQMAVNTGYAKQAPKPAAQEKIETLQKGAQASKALGNGAAPAGLPTMEQIADMDEEEFARFKADLGKKGLSMQDVMK